jgi:signal transduction histidine kinase
MRLSIRSTQIVAVSALVGVVVVVLSAMHVTRLAQTGLTESEARGELLANAIFHRVRQVVIESPDPYLGIQADPGLQALLQASIYGASVTDAAILDIENVIVAHSDAARVGQRLGPRPVLQTLIDAGAWSQLRGIYSGSPATLDVQMPMELDGEAFGSIRVGTSTRLLRQELSAALRPALVTAAIALGAAILIAALLARLVLRPIHVLRSGLTRLGQGEFGVLLDLPPGDEFGELGAYFNDVSRQLSTDRAQLGGEKNGLQPRAERPEDAVALFGPEGNLLFADSGMATLLPEESLGRTVADLLPEGHLIRTMLETTFASRTSKGPERLSPAGGADDRLLRTHAIVGGEDGLRGVLLISRNASYLTRIQTTLAYSRKLVALGRLTAGIAHEVKNPLNAMMIHLELLRSKIGAAVPEARHPDPVAAGSLGLSSAPTPAAEAAALQHVGVIESEIRRLDEVIQDFLKFTRPEELQLAPVSLCALMDDIGPLIQAEAERHGVTVEAPRPDPRLAVSGDAATLRQVLMNLTINACQAMTGGGTLRVTAAAQDREQVEIKVTDTGVGIPPEDLKRIFDLYFTTKDHGTGIGLSMVYRIVQMHDGEIDVESTLGRGTTFCIVLPRAHEIA